jgi:hypothetical protein
MLVVESTLKPWIIPADYTDSFSDALSYCRQCHLLGGKKPKSGARSAGRSLFYLPAQLPFAWMIQ